MASSLTSSITHPLLSNNNSNIISSNHVLSISFPGTRKLVGKKNYAAMAQPQRSAMQYNQLGDSNLVVSEITFGTVSSFFIYQLQYYLFFYEF